MRRLQSKAAQELLARQKKAADTLRREVLGPGLSRRHPYFRDLNRELSASPDPIPIDDLIEACEASDIVYLGDFHSDPACQSFAAEILSHLARRFPVALGVEFLYTRQQRLLDAFLRGQLDEATFLRRVHYREEWGYPWQGFRELLRTARDLGVPVHALDSPPRGGCERLALRDAHAARRIVSIVGEDPARRLVVLFGESHVSSGHLPRRVLSGLRRLRLERRVMTVFQDPDAAYWVLLADKASRPVAARLGPGAYAVFHTSPLAKYEAYRQVLERWREDVPQDEEVDLTPAVHHLIGVLLDWLGIDSRRHRVRHREGWSEELADTFPEVYSGPEAAELLAPILEEHGRSHEEVGEARSLLRDRGALYESRSNTLFVLRYLPGPAAAEGARFLRTVLSGRLFEPVEPNHSEPVSRAYGAAYNEALAYLGARLVDPASDFLGSLELREAMATEGSVADASQDEPEMRRLWLDAHRRFETSGQASVPDGIAEPLRRSRLLRRCLARDLGHRLGRVLFQRVRTGRLDRRGLRSLFTRTLPPRKAARTVIDLLRA